MTSETGWHFRGMSGGDEGRLCYPREQGGSLRQPELFWLCHWCQCLPYFCHTQLLMFLFCCSLPAAWRRLSALEAGHVYTHIIHIYIYVYICMCIYIYMCTFFFSGSFLPLVVFFFFFFFPCPSFPYLGSSIWRVCAIGVVLVLSCLALSCVDGVSGF